MTKFKNIVFGTALAATALTAAAPASAQTYYRNYRHGGDSTATAIGAGILGVIVGTAIASSNNRGYYGNTYRNGGYYEGYRYNDGYFYDRQNRRLYDRNTWERRHAYDRRSYQGGYQYRDRDYDRDYDRGQYGYQGGYNGYNGYNGGTYNGGTYYNGGGYNGTWGRGY